MAEEMSFERAMELLGGVKVSFDYHRNVTICCKCRKRAPLGGSYAYLSPGWKEEDCRRLCETCSLEPPSVDEVVRDEKKEAVAIMAEVINKLEEENRTLRMKLKSFESTGVPVVFGTRRCEYCGKDTRVTTAGCDHCDVEDK